MKYPRLHKFLSHLSSIASREGVGFLLGVFASLAASYIYAAQTSHNENKEYRQSEVKELISRITRAEQSMVMSFPGNGSAATYLKIIDMLYKSTESQTGDLRFEGKRVDNITYDLEQRINGSAMYDLLEDIRYTWLDVAFADRGTKKDIYKEPTIKEVHEKLLDYRCCLSTSTGQEDIGCLGEYLLGKHYCLYIDNKIYLAPNGGFIKNMGNNNIISFGTNNDKY